MPGQKSVSSGGLAPNLAACLSADGLWRILQSSNPKLPVGNPIPTSNWFVHLYSYVLLCRYTTSESTARKGLKGLFPFPISKVIEEQSYMLPEDWFGFPLEKMQLHLN